MNPEPIFAVFFAGGIVIGWFLFSLCRWAYREGFNFTGSPKCPIQPVRVLSTGETNPANRSRTGPKTYNFMACGSTSYPINYGISITVPENLMPITQASALKSIKRDIESQIGDREDLTNSLTILNPFDHDGRP